MSVICNHVYFVRVLCACYCMWAVADLNTCIAHISQIHTYTHSKYNTYLPDNKATGGCASLEGEEGVMHACLLRMSLSLRAKREVKSLGRTRFVVSLAIRGSMHVQFEYRLMMP
jgi:hypothetical protein